MIDRFTKEDFEAYLENHKPYEPLGLVAGEYTYRLQLDGQCAIMIRSSIKADSQAAESGKDSIRLWLVGNDDKPIGSKLDSWTTRVSGWRTRLTGKIKELVQRRINAGDCRECKSPMGIYKRKSDKSLFVKCFPCTKRLGRHINGSLNSEGWFSQASQMGAYNESVQTSVNNQHEMAYSGHAKLETAMRMGKNQAKLGDQDTDPGQSRNSGLDKGGDNLQELSQKNALNEFLANPFDDNSEQKPTFEPSEYQKAIYNFVETGNGHGVVEGVAGCGKTTTNVEALKLVPRNLKTKYAAFNKHIEEDISKKAPAHVDVSTFHKWGLSNIKRAYPKINLNQWKVHNLIDDKSPQIERDFKNEVVKAISLLKGNLLDPTQENIMKIARDFGLDIAENDCQFIRQIFFRSIEDFNEIDFDDMVYYAAAGIVSCEKFDYIFVDEAQDMNTAQYIMCKKSLAKNGRMLLIGDPNQSIYAFRGAHIGIMDFMTDEMNATRLPLTISYRAPLAIVNHVNAHYPHITFEAAETAENGKIEWISLDQFYTLIGQNDGVLCRTNAPLVEPCFSLIRRGIKATILGRDIGAGLIKLIEKREKLRKVTDLDSLLDQIQTYCNNESRKALAQKKEARAAMLQDQAETIWALSADCETIRDLKSKTKSVFSNKKEGVVFSTVHKAKGLEWERVFVLGPKGNHPMGDEAQETNIRYVRDTRTLNELYFVED